MRRRRPPSTADPEPPASARRPDDPSWRADALAPSPHSRLTDQLRPALAAPDPARSAAICAAVCRAQLRELAPALMLLPRATRERCQALGAFSLALFDFARQPGVEGERLAQINRWEFELEAALSGEPAPQPVFLRLAAEENRSPWPRPPFEGLLRIARAWATAAPAESLAGMEGEMRQLARCLVAALAGDPPPAALAELVAVHLRLRLLAGLDEDLARGRSRLPAADIERLESATPPRTPAAVREWRVAELRRLSVALGPPLEPMSLPPELRAATVYLRLAADALLRVAERPSSRGARGRPSIGGLGRIALLLRALWKARRPAGATLGRGAQ